MIPAVLDASVVLSWFFADQASPECDQMLDYVRDFGALVPGSWSLDVAHLILQAEKRGKILMYDAAGRLEMIAALPITVDQNMVGYAWSSIMDLARSEQLSIYDATYLELAMRRRSRLFTRNGRLRAAAERCQVKYSVN